MLHSILMKRAKSVKRILDLYDKLGLATIVSCSNGRREFTYAGLDAVAAFQFMQQQILVGRRVFVFPNPYPIDLEDTNNSEEYFINKTIELRKLGD